MTLELSVALVTRNRPDSLERTLRSLRAQPVQPVEVVVSDDSTDADADRVRQLCELYDCRYVDGPRRGLYANRNRAALACGGSHIRTMDDDHEFPPGHVAACCDAVRADPGAVWIIGECLPGEEDTPLPRRCPPQLHPRGYSMPPGSGPMWAMADGAAILPRWIFDRGERYAEDFLFGASYLEWGSRLHWLGVRIRHLDTTFVIHHYRHEDRSFSDARIDLGSRVFAGACHSFLYQPSLRNRLLTMAELGVVGLRHRRAGLRAVSAGLRAYRRRRRVPAWPAAAGRG